MRKSNMRILAGATVTDITFYPRLGIPNLTMRYQANMMFPDCTLGYAPWRPGRIFRQSAVLCQPHRFVNVQRRETSIRRYHSVTYRPTGSQW